MKKVISLVLMALFVSQLAIAANFSVSPKTSVNFYDSLKTSVDAGFNVEASNLPYLPSEVLVGSGLAYTNTNTKDSNESVNLYSVPVYVGYKLAIDSKLSVTPKAGVDIVYAQSNKNDTSVLGDFGADFNYAINPNWVASLGGNYRVGDVKVNGVTKNVDGLGVNAKVTYSF